MLKQYSLSLLQHLYPQQVVNLLILQHTQDGSPLLSKWLVVLLGSLDIFF